MMSYSAYCRCIDVSKRFGLVLYKLDVIDDFVDGGLERLHNSDVYNRLVVLLDDKDN